jgi:hypothetical protein
VELQIYVCLRHRLERSANGVPVLNYGSGLAAKNTGLKRSFALLFVTQKSKLGKG